MSGSIPAKLELASGPECPENLVYLVEWTYRLHGRSGASLAGILPVSHQEIYAWSALNSIQLDPLEVEAILELDAALCAPEPSKKAKEEQQEEIWQTRKWPTRKQNVLPVLATDQE